MSSHDEVAERVAVALVGRRDEARAQLQAALTEFGAELVFEGEPGDIDLAALQRTAPGVLIVNLDPGIEDALDHLQAVLDDPAVNVVFNDAEVTRQLHGWDLARWARHLAAKVLGHGDTNPPPPASAEALPSTHFVPRPGAPPTPAELAGERHIEEFTVEADDHADAIPTDYMPMELPSRAGAVEASDGLDLGIDLDAIHGALLVGADHAAPEVAAAAVPGSVAGDDDAPIDFGIDLSVLDAALAEPVARSEHTGGAATAGEGRAVLDAAMQDLGIGLDLDLIDADLAEVALPEAASAATDVDAIPTAAAAFSGFDSEDLEFRPDEDLERLAAQFDSLAGDAASAAVAGSGEGLADEFLLDDGLADADGGFGAEAGTEPGPGFDLQLAGEGEGEVGAPAKVAPASSAAASGFDFGSLELAPIEDGEAGAPVAKAGAAAAAPSFDFSSIGLSLEPLEGEAATATVTAAADADVAPGTLRRVIVLGASIGGPDALRTFLGGIPQHFPALFVLAQHLENGFFERLAQQLQKSAHIPVRVASDGHVASHGEVLVVPADRRVSIAADGTVGSSAHAEAPRYQPSIDTVMHDVADTFGARALAIVFSGMAGDAIEGSVYLTGKGGEVWAQTPDSCVVSSMVDGASARGVVEFFGTPRELAERCVARFGTPA